MRTSYSLESPESVLNSSPGVARALHPDHKKGHQGEEDGDNEAEPVDCLISNHHSAVHLILIINNSHITSGTKLLHLDGTAFKSTKSWQAMGVHESPMGGAEGDLNR